MKKLDYELTKKMFDCTSKDDVKALYETGADLESCSRLSIDEVLGKVFNRTCHGTKELAIQMLVGEINGTYVPDVADTSVTYENNSKNIQLDPVERKQRIASRLGDIVGCLKSGSGFIYLKKAVKDAELKLLGTTEEDIARLLLEDAKNPENTDLIESLKGTLLCKWHVDGKLYLVKNDDASRKMVTSDWEDTILN